jgi:hypothetical protein
MSSPKILCGAIKSNGGTCQREVSKLGERCHDHKDKPLSAKSILKLCYATIRVVADLGGAYAAFQIAYPHIMSLLAPVLGQLMPEDFWDYGFKPKDVARMLQEEKEAHKKSKALEEKYSWYSDHDKLRVERAYREILAYAESVKVSA